MTIIACLTIRCPWRNYNISYSSAQLRSGVVLIEALASGISLIVTKCGGPADIVNPENGILIDVGSEDQLAAAMVKIVKRHANYRPEQLRAETQSKYGEKAFVDRAISIYQKAIQERA